MADNSSTHSAAVTEVSCVGGCAQSTDIEQSLYTYEPHYINSQRGTLDMPHILCISFSR